METHRELEVAAMAQIIASALAADEDALVQGSIDGRATIIDGHFDLLSVAAAVIDAWEARTRIEINSP